MFSFINFYYGLDYKLFQKIMIGNLQKKISGEWNLWINSKRKQFFVKGGNKKIVKMINEFQELGLQFMISHSE